MSRHIWPVFATDVLTPGDVEAISVKTTGLSAQSFPEDTELQDPAAPIEIACVPSFRGRMGREAIVAVSTKARLPGRADVTASFLVRVRLAPGVEPEILRLPQNLGQVAQYAEPYAAQAIASLTAELGLAPLIVPGFRVADAGREREAPSQTESSDATTPTDST